MTRDLRRPSPEEGSEGVIVLLFGLIAAALVVVAAVLRGCN